MSKSTASAFAVTAPSSETETLRTISGETPGGAKILIQASISLPWSLRILLTVFAPRRPRMSLCAARCCYTATGSAPRASRCTPASKWTARTRASSRRCCCDSAGSLRPPRTAAKVRAYRCPPLRFVCAGSDALITCGPGYILKDAVEDVVLLRERVLKECFSASASGLGSGSSSSLPRCYAFGTSMGGAVITLLAERHPEVSA